MSAQRNLEHISTGTVSCRCRRVLRGRLVRPGAWNALALVHSESIGQEPALINRIQSGRALVGSGHPPAPVAPGAPARTDNHARVLKRTLRRRCGYPVTLPARPRAITAPM